MCAVHWIKKKRPLDSGTVPDPVDSICHIVWVLINPKAASTKMAVSWKWSNRKVCCQSWRVAQYAGEISQIPGGHSRLRWPQVVHAHPPPPCLPLSCISSQIWCSGGRVRGRGCTGIIKPTWINRTAPSLFSKASSWGELNPCGPLSRPLNKLPPFCSSAYTWTRVCVCVSSKPSFLCLLAGGIAGH